MLLLSYVDDNIQEAEVDLASFSGVDIPVLLLKKSQSDYIYQNNETKGKENLVMNINFKKDQIIADDANKLMIFMSSQPIRNPVIKFLADLRRHQKLIDNKELEIVFSVGFCTSCKDSGYLEKASRCLSAGKYCAINSLFKTDELVKETLRQICIRNYYGNNKLIMYLEHMNHLAEKEIASTFDILNTDESCLNRLSEIAMRHTRIHVENISECFLDSFIKRNTSQNLTVGGTVRKDIDIYYDDNSLLQKEQQRFLQITKINIFPLIIIDDVLYDSRINLRTFIDFACKRDLLDCKGFNEVKNIFVNSLLVICSIFILLVLLICKKNIEKKLRFKMNSKFQIVMGKYYKLRSGNVECDSLDRNSSRSQDRSMGIYYDRDKNSHKNDSMMDNSIISQFSTNSTDKVEIPIK